MINSLSHDDYIGRSIGLLSQGGRFMEIGKRGVWSHEQVKEVRPDVHYEKIAADVMMETEPWRYNGYLKRLQIVGAGYNAKQKGQDLVLKLGYANELVYRIPAGIDVGIERDIVSVSGIDKQLVGEFAAKIRLAQNPEPYNGKGVRYFGEVIIKKQGKAFGA